MARRRTPSARSVAMASASALASRGGTSRPVSPGTMASRQPGWSVVTTARPEEHDRHARPLRHLGVGGEVDAGSGRHPRLFGLEPREPNQRVPVRGVLEDDAKMGMAERQPIEHHDQTTNRLGAKTPGDED